MNRYIITHCYETINSISVFKISALYKHGWINGYEDGSFRPDASISKYFVKFTDIGVNNWAYCDILELSITRTAADFN